MKIRYFVFWQVITLISVQLMMAVVLGREISVWVLFYALVFIPALSMVAWGLGTFCYMLYRKLTKSRKKRISNIDDTTH